MFLSLALIFLISYLVGSIPFAVIVARRYGVDIFRSGSGNPGATNVKRTCGKKAGNLVFALDMLKGFLPAFCPLILSCFVPSLFEYEHATIFAQLAGFLGAVLGHCFSIFLGFKGGKGVSTTIGGLLGVMPIALIIGGLIWLGVYFLSRIVAIASIALGLSLPIASYLLFKFFPQLNYGIIHIGFCIFIMIFIIVMHQSNIRRLLKGEENTFRKKQ